MKKSLLFGSLAVALAVCACCDPGRDVARAGDKAPQGDKLAALINDLDSKDENVRLTAATQLQELGPKAATAAPALAKLFTDKNEDVRLNASLALGKIGKASVAALKGPLTSDDEDVRYYALSAVGWIGPDAKAIAPQVIASLNHKSEAVRRKAAYALGSIAPGPKVALPVLIKAFGDENPDVRQAASEAVAKLGQGAVAALIEALRDESVGIRQQAVRALGDIGGDAKAAIPNLRALLFETAGKVQPEAAEALGKIGKEAIATLVEGTKNDNATVRQLSVGGLAKVGAVAVPDLVDALGAKYVDVRRQAAQVLSPMRINDKMVVLGLGYALKDEDEQVRVQAASALAQLQLGAKLAAPMLTEALVDSNMQVRRIAYQALQSTGTDPRPGLTKGLKSKDMKVRINTAALMVEVGHEINDALPVLREALKEKDNTLQMQAAFLLAQRQQDVETILPILTTGLKNKSVGTRQQALQGLQSLNTKASAAAPLILEVVLKDENTGIRQQALNALQNIGGDTKLMMPAFTKLMKEGDAPLRTTVVQLAWRHGREGLKLLLAAQNDKDQNVRQQATWALQNVQGDLKDALPEILPLLKSKEQFTRQIAVQLLARAGEGAVPHLLEALKDSDNQVRWNAVNGLRNIPNSGKLVVPALLDIIEKGKDTQERQFAIHALAQQGPDSYKSLFELYKKVKDDDVRAVILQNLGNYGRQTKEVLPYMMEGLKDKAKQVRLAAATALNQMGGNAKPAIPLLTETLKDEEANVRQYAMYALVNVGPEGVPGLIEALKSKDDNLRHETLQYISRFGNNKAALPVLIDVLKTSTNPQTRWMACNLLGNYGADAKDAVPALTAALQDANPTVRQHAQTALNRIQPPKK